VIRKLIIPHLLLLTLAIGACAQPPKYLEITFVTTNDIHSRLLPWDIPGDPEKNIPAVKGIGGAARRATVINRIRAETRTPVFVTDSGDLMYRNSYIGRSFHGEADIAVLNATGYDAMVPGNHDFEWSGPELLALIGKSKVPWVCANLAYADTGNLLLPPYVIKEGDGVRVAFFGLITAETTGNPNLYLAATDLNLEVLPYVEAAEKLVPELRKQADIVVLLSHLGQGLDAQVAQKVAGIDIILGGHWHAMLMPPRMATVSQPTAFSLGAVPIVQVGAYGDYVGRTRVIFRRDDSGRYALMSCKGEVIHIDGTIPDDQEIVRVLDEFKKTLPQTAAE